MSAHPGQEVSATIRLVLKEGLTPLAAKPVRLEAFDEEIGTWRTVTVLQTGPDGRTTIGLKMPTSPGVYKFRSTWLGEGTLLPDESPEVRIKVVS